MVEFTAPLCAGPGWWSCHRHRVWGWGLGGGPASAAKRERTLSEDGFRYHLHAQVGEAGEAGHINYP